MCWVALDSAVALANRLHVGDKVDEWTATRADIRQTVIRELETPYFGSDDLDAST
jgi:GH15 family glucan-1,4-alpha-glucosidase